MASQSKIGSRDELTEEIKRLESTEGSAIKPNLPKVELEEIDYTPPSDEYIKINAEKDLKNYYDTGIAGVKKDWEESGRELERKRAAYESGRDGELRELDSLYKTAARAIDSDVIKRGMARSSVAAVEKGALEREYLGKNASVIEAYGKNISDIDTELASLGAKLSSALNDFNLSYAAKLNEKIGELKAARDKRESEVKEFNNDVRRKQAELEYQRLKNENSLYSAEISNKKKAQTLDDLPAERRDAIYRAVYDTMDSYLSNMTPAEAEIELNSHSVYRAHLSNYYYNKLYEKYGRAVK